MENKELSTDTQKFLELNGRKIILVGTAHVSAQSIEEVTKVIGEQKPDNVAIELDENRLKNIQDPDSWRKMDIVKVLKNKQGFLLFANIILASYQKRMGVKADVKPGDEMVAAIKKAQEMGIPQTMVDRPIAVTLRRAWAMNSFWGKCKLLSVLIASAFSKEEADPEEIEKLKEKSEMDSMMSEMSEYLPKVREVLIDERDRYLASHIWDCKGEKVVAVLGAGHLPGVIAHLEKLAAAEETSDCSDISQVPAKKVISKVIGWAIPVIIVALIALGYVFGGKKVGNGMILAWILCNAIPAGVGAVISAGHPLTIIASALLAPFTSLCPLVGVGIFSGIIQALVKKPQVNDLEKLQDDAGGFIGWYKNKVLRVLLVFIFSSLGSSIGTWVAIAKFGVELGKTF